MNELLMFAWRDLWSLSNLSLDLSLRLLLGEELPQQRVLVLALKGLFPAPRLPLERHLFACAFHFISCTTRLVAVLAALFALALPVVTALIALFTLTLLLVHDL